MITVVATLCTLVSPASPTAAPVQVCHEEIVVRSDNLQDCMLFPPALAQWKQAGRFKGDDWLITRVRCEPGFYEKKDEL